MFHNNAAYILDGKRMEDFFLIFPVLLLICFKNKHEHLV